MISHKAKERQSGAAAVEFALVVPVLLLILFSIIYFSIYFNAKQGVQAAAREGARVASLRSSSSANACFQATGSLGGIGIDNTFVEVASAAPTGTATSNSCASSAYTCSTSGSNVYVRVSGQVTISIPFWPNSGVKNVSSTAMFLCE
ncbi:MAG: pilus assembly protein [Acidimicrobiia bacterium]|nr:pilus assembly protein [Acidimicrobiia bacterium]